MIKIIKSIIITLAVSALLVGISGCKNNGTTAEDVGKEIDQAIDKAGQEVDTAVKKTGEGIDAAIDKTKEGIDSAVDKTGREVEKVGKEMQD